MSSKYYLSSLTYLFIISLQFVACKSMHPPGQIENVVTYEHCPPGGTSMSLRNDLENNRDLVDNKPNNTYQIDAKDLTIAMKTAKLKRHFQQKIAGIDLGGKFYINGNPHYFVYFFKENMLIDLTGMITYIFTQPLRFHRIRE